MWLRVFLSLLLFTSCRGRTVVSENEKVTALELFSAVAYGPRRIQEIDAGISLNPQVQKCFRSAPQTAPVTVTLSGKVLYGGQLDGLSLTPAGVAIQPCLLEALKSVNLGRGRIGPFKMQLSTDRTRLPGAKSLILDSTEVKKFE